MRASLSFGLLAASMALADPEEGSASATTVNNRTFKLHHRFLPPSSAAAGTAQPGWTEFASFPAGPSTILSETAAVTHVAGTSGDAAGIKGDAQGWYQVGVETDVGWVMGSTRACYLEKSDSATIVVHMTGETPTSLFVLPPGGVPASGDCPVQARDRSVALSAVHPRGKDIKVVLKRPQRVDGPRLAPPPPVDESTGQPVPPPVEKTFFQKYWLPMLGIGLFAVSQLAPAEDPRQAGKK